MSMTNPSLVILFLALSSTTMTAAVREESTAAAPPGSFRLLNRVDMPLVGFGTAGLGDLQESAPLYALMLGFRHIDTAQATEWYNEAAISKSIAASMLPRKDIFLVTKVHPRNFGYEQTLISFEDPDTVMTSLGQLRTDYVDLLLLHTSDCSDWTGLCQPDPERGTFFDAWRALEKLYELEKVRAIGVSNFNVSQLEALSATARVPVHVVQNHMDPLRQDREVRAWCKARGVLYTSYSTLGSQWQHQSSAQGERKGGKNPVLSHPVVQRLAKRHNISAALLVLTWALQEGVAVIPRSTQVEHIEELARLLPKHEGGLGVVLSEGEMEEMRGLDGEEPWKVQTDEL
ncbi:hypothetical protein VYU27_001888 [Nannochloropsis oceanica]